MNNKEKNLRFRKSIFSWWMLRGSNPRPSVRQTDALPAELNIQPHKYNKAIIFVNSFNRLFKNKKP